MIERLVRWVIFGALAALVPLAARYLALELNQAPASLADVLKRGELLLLTAALCVAAIGELIGSGRRAVVWKIIAAGGATLTMFVAVLYFAHVGVAHANEGTVDSAAIVSTSIWLYGFASICSGCCILLSEV